MKKILFLLLILVVIFSCGMVSMAGNPQVLGLTVTVDPGASYSNILYTAKIYPPFDAPKLVKFYTAPNNGTLTFVGSAWSNELQIATIRFHQDRGSYMGKATCELPAPYGLVESNIVYYTVP